MDIAGRTVHVVYTGLRDGEKLHEELFGIGEEADFRPIHPAISHVKAPPLDAVQIRAAERVAGQAAALHGLTGSGLRLYGSVA
jgi:FlaA1/EpsC-like NDP-sugar epimerase